MDLCSFVQNKSVPFSFSHGKQENQGPTCWNVGLPPLTRPDLKDAVIAKVPEYYFREGGNCVKYSFVLPH